MGMSNYVSRVLVITALMVAPGKAVWGAERHSHKPDHSSKLDHVLQNAIADGCSGGPQQVIITVKSGYRKGMSDTLKAHGDKVKGEFKSINAVAAKVHCYDLETLANMRVTVSVSIDGDVNGHGKRTPAEVQAQAAASLKAPVFQSTTNTQLRWLISAVER